MSRGCGIWRVEVLADWTINGSVAHRYRGNLNVRRDGVNAVRLISDVAEVAFSLGSACGSGSGKTSHVLRAMGLSERETHASIRLGFGRYTTEEELRDRARPDQRGRATASAVRRMTLVRFISADGKDASGGGRAARRAPARHRAGCRPAARGTCEGQMACSTCHVIVAAEDFAKLPRASEEEEDMLDLASHVTRHSRLACQIWLTDGAGHADRAHAGRRPQHAGAMMTRGCRNFIAAAGRRR